MNGEGPNDDKEEDEDDDDVILIPYIRGMTRCIIARVKEV